MKFLTGLLCAALLAGCGAKAPEGSFVQDESGVVVTPAAGNARRVRLEVRSDHIVRVTAVADENLELPASLMVIGSEGPRGALQGGTTAATMSRSPPRDSSRMCRWPTAP